MNNILIFQHIYSNTEAADWTALTLPRHVRYAALHLMDFRYIQADPPHPQYGLHNVGHWAMVYYLKEFMSQGYEQIVYLDHDAIIVDMQADFRRAFVPDKIGAVWHDLSQFSGNLSHFNDGVLLVSNTAIVRKFVDQWLALYPGGERWREQGVFNELGTEQGIIHRLDNAWNAGHVSPSDHKIVWGLHGMPHRLIRMKEALQKIEEAENEIA